MRAILSKSGVHSLLMESKNGTFFIDKEHTKTISNDDLLEGHYYEVYFKIIRDEAWNHNGIYHQMNFPFGCYMKEVYLFDLKEKAL